ncbi:MAG: hypothetical protein KDC84_08055 [Crocinitomicaceae bacterium]|nr:hypothetical protein [Crocinitomicaceae bacterium]
MRGLLIISIFATFVISCTKVTEKNIRGNWQITSQTFNGQNVTVTQFSAVWTFNQSPECLYSLDWSTSPLVHNYSLDKNNQKLTISNFIVSVDVDTFVTLNYISTITFDVEKKGKKMTWRSPGDSIVCNLELIYPDY